MKNVAAIILAAGKGERMKSGTPKVMHPVCSRPMLEYVLDLVKAMGCSHTIAVLGYKYELVRTILPPKVKAVVQKRIVGTADAVKQALPFVRSFKGPVVILYGDTPLLTKETVEKLVKHHLETKAAATLLTVAMENPAGYGRILRDRLGSIAAIVEEKDADEFQKGIKEVNTGIICFDRKKLAECIKLVKADNAKKEYYLTDVVKILRARGEFVETVRAADALEVMGVNSRVELAQAHKCMQRRIQEAYMRDGVTIVDPDSTFISFGAKIGTDTVIYPFTAIEKDVIIGKQCSVGPFARLRPGTRLDDQVVVGNFIEISRSKLSSRSRAKHFGFIGDTTVGQSANIGAGTVTANYDGRNKNKTVIRDGAFIGCDTVLVAPVRIGRAARTGAGSVVTRGKNVPDRGVVVGVPARALQVKRKSHE